MHLPSFILRPYRNIVWAGMLLVFLVNSLIFSSCSHSPSLAPDINDDPHPTIIVVPGYYGTRLVRESDEKLIWISPSEALFGNQPLTLPVPGLELANTIELQPTDILDTVSVIPLLYSVDVYGSLLDTLHSAHHGRVEVIPLAYDWRQDLMDAVRKLDDLIRALHTEGKHDISLVAHSLGGLIVSYYLRYGAQRIESASESWEGAERVSSVVMAGVPFLGVMNSFRNMNFGVSVYFNEALLTSEAYSSFPSSYYTLPVFESDQLVTPERQSLNGKIRNPENWEKFGWGLLTNQTELSPTITKNRAEYMSGWLQRSQRFFALLRAPLAKSTTNHPSMLYIFGKGTPTLDSGVWMKNETYECNCLFFNNPERSQVIPSIDASVLYYDGDETVTVRSSTLPLAYRKAFDATIHEYDLGHTELVTNSNIQKKILSFLESR